MILSDPDSLARYVAGWLTDLARAAPGTFALAISGGSTPRRLFEVLAEPAQAAKFPWEKLRLFWVDERHVPYDHPDSNYRMTKLALLDHVDLPPAQIHPMPTSLTPAEDAAAYQRTLQGFYSSNALDSDHPLFDVILLGLGEDGHTASLFPGTPGLAERHSWVIPVTENVPQPRISLTYPAIASSRTVAFLVEGASKASIAALVQAGDPRFPASHVHSAGSIVWFSDLAASGK